MSKRILITGAASGFGKGAAIELAKRGHSVVAGVQVPPQKTTLMQDAADAGVELDIIVLDITNEAHRQVAFRQEIDVLINNAGIMEAGPVAEIPMEYVRQNFETNVFGTLAMIQGFAPQMVKRGSGKIINVTSIVGLITVPFAAIYASTKHALEGITEGLKMELVGTGVEVCIVNPGVFGTGFNDRGGETAMRWFNPETSLCNPDFLSSFLASQEDSMNNQLDPQILIDALVRIAEEESSKFRNVIPDAIVPWIKATQDNAWEAGKDDSLWIDPTAS